MPEHRFEITKVLEISTVHVTPHDLELLKSDSTSNNPVTLLAHSYREGAWLYCGDADTCPEQIELATARGYSKALCDLLKTASQAGCVYIRLDADAPMYDTLPKMEWPS